MKVLITGGSGFIGKQLVTRLKDSGCKVVCLNRSEGNDITNTTTFNLDFEADVVFHLASRTSVPESYEYPQKYFVDNVTGTTNVCDYCRRVKAKLVFLSTYVYGEPKSVPVDETHPINPHSPYTFSKYLSEEVIKAYAKFYSLDALVFRLFNVFGPGQGNGFIFTDIFNQMLEGKNVVKLQNPTPKRDYLYIEDLITVLAHFGLKIDIQGFETVNLGSGKSYSVEEVVEICKSKFNYQGEIEYSSYVRPNEVNNIVADIEKLKSHIKFDFLSIEESIARYILVLKS
jgi:UDP-glucose 4-epimerase